MPSSENSIWFAFGESKVFSETRQKQKTMIIKPGSENSAVPDYNRGQKDNLPSFYYLEKVKSF